MKLIFPNGEHAPVVLAPGINRVGSGSDCQVVIVAPGVALDHCEIEIGNSGNAVVRVRDADAATVLNGRQVNESHALKVGDLLLFARVGCRVVAEDRVATEVVAPPVREEDDGRTRIRAALPKYMLRGVSGSTFSKIFPLNGSMTIGRHSDCDISIPGEEISRHHARLQVTPAGVRVEDMGSSNGTWINGKRITEALLQPGEELRLDTVRFLLVTPGMPTSAVPTAAVEPVAAAAQKRGKGGWGIGAAIISGLLLLAFALARRMNLF